MPASNIICEEGIPSYLTRIIASPLHWIEPDAEKESIWEAASARLAERSGRTAIPAVTRTFHIPIAEASEGEDTLAKTLDITLHEPSLTDDNLGHKTWVASYLLALRLPTLLKKHFPSSIEHKPATAPTQSPSSKSSYPRDLSPSPSPPRSTTTPRPPSPHHSTTTTPPSPSPLPRILELGAGTGLVGLAASALIPASSIHLTDLPSILPNLLHNTDFNAHLAARCGSVVTAGVLDWSSVVACNNREAVEVDCSEKYDLILAADSLYAPEHPRWLVETMAAYLKKDTAKARIFVSLPIRGGNEASSKSAEHQELRVRMRERRFRMLEEGQDVGFDDWGELQGSESYDERQAVECWWSVWAWA